MACPGQHTAYSVEHIQVLEGLEPIRRRPGMFLGETGARGPHSLLFDLVTESLAEVNVGHGRSVRVALLADGSAEVADDGRIPPDIERAFGRLPAGHGYRPPGAGRIEFPYIVANALSEWLRVEACAGAEVRVHRFRRGETESSARLAGAFARSGLTVAFKPDPKIFGAATFDAPTIRERLRQLAYLHSGVRITFTDEAAGTHDVFDYADGIRAYVAHLNADRTSLHAEPILIRGEEQGVRYEVGLQWCEEEEVRRSFANHYFTRNGGTHDSGLRHGVATGLRDFIQAIAGKFEGEDLRAGLTAVVSVWLSDPMFSGATRDQLSNPEVEGVVKAAVRRGMCDYFEANRTVAERVVKAVVAARDSRKRKKR